MYSDVIVKNYDLIKKVYKNYISFQEKIASEIQNIDKKKINILEIGTGTGITTNIIISAKEGIKLDTIDSNPQMINIAMGKIKTSYLNEVNFYTADALKYLSEIKNKKYDMVISAFTIHNLTISCRKYLYKEIYRTLNSDGIFINADKFIPDNPDMKVSSFKYRICSYIDVLMKEGKYNLLKDWIQHYIDDLSPDKIMQIKTEKNIIRCIGFNKQDYIFKSEPEMLAILKTQK